MLRIRRSMDRGTVTLHLEGKLLAPWLDELRSAIADTSDGRVGRMNLADVSFIDAAGAKLLARMRRDGVSIDGCSAFVAGLLKVHDQ